MPQGKYLHLIDIIFAAKNSGKTKKEIKKVFDEIKKGRKPLTKVTKKMGDFERALRRAAIVAPVWMALRTAMMSFFRGFSTGFAYMEEFNRAMLKAQAVVHGTIGNMSDVIDDLKGRIRTLATETGESMTKISSAFYRFGTVGMEFEKAWSGAEASVRFAMATMGDADQTAKTMALVFNLLGDTIDKNIPITEQYEVQMAKLYKLWQINAFEADQLTESFRQFLPVANTMKLTIDETSALLATLNSAALQGSRGGRLLRTSFSKLLDNTDKLASSLGLYVNPQLENSFTLFMKVLKVVKDLAAQEILPLAAQQLLSGVFGGVRGGQPVRALVSLYDELQVNLELTTKSYNKQKDAIAEYNKRVDDVKNSVSGQLKIFRELRTQLFEQFITGITGADEFAKGLQTINILMEQLSRRALVAGQALNILFTPRLKTHFMPVFIWEKIKLDKKKQDELRQKIQDAFDKKLTLQQTIELSTELVTKFPKSKEMLEISKQLIGTSTEIAKDAIRNAKFQEKINKEIIAYDKKHFKAARELNKEKDKTIQVNQNILRTLDLQKTAIEDQLAIIKLQGEGYTSFDLTIAKIALEVSKIVEEYNSLDAIMDGIVPSLNKQKVLSMVLSENWKEVLHSMEGYPPIQEKILALAKSVNTIELQKQKILNKQKEAFTDIYMEYEKADKFERARIRRLLELRNMEADELKRAFEFEAYDKSLILEYWSSFSQKGQTAIGEVLRKLYNLPEAQIKLGIDAANVKSKLRGTGAIKFTQPTAPVTIPNIVNKGAETINVTVEAPTTTPEEMAKLVGNEIKDKLLADENFQNAFSKKISPKV